MQITNEFMVNLTKKMPCRNIEIDVKPYINRYFSGRAGKFDLWIHQWLSADDEKHLHSHAMRFWAVPVLGGYTEEFLNDDKSKSDRYFGAANYTQYQLSTLVAKAQAGLDIPRLKGSRLVDVYDWHRIKDIQPHTWTLLLVDQRRLPFWYFMNDNGTIEKMETQGKDWFKTAGKRK